uniref:POU domain, class 3, transcription factor 3-like n=1 Tax=Petromyzon marinus TaxID=7757 RepID=A0AAJ7SM10_PETMA|nr:POU domain, class 3, transcription factor 3-like [Petromyzon marinus]
MQAETGPALKDLPDVTVFSTCTADCQKYGHSDNCWMPPGTASEAAAALPLRAFTLGRPRGGGAAAAAAVAAASSALALSHGRGLGSSSPAAVGAVGAVGAVAVLSSSSSSPVAAVAVGPRPHEAGKSRQADAYYNAFYSNNYRSHRPEMYHHHHQHQHQQHHGGGVAGAEKIPLAELKARPFDDDDDDGDDDDDEEEEEEDEDMEGAGSEELPLTSQPYRQSSVPVGTPQDFGSKELYL